VKTDAGSMKDPHRISPLWSETDGGPRAAEVALPRSTNLVIVGGGILGLSTALHAARRGTDVLVLDARAPGEGASGLNGGQVIPGLKHDPEALEAMLGRERGGRLAAFAAGTADRVFDLIRDEKLTVPHARQGWILAAHTPGALEGIHRRARALGAETGAVEALDAAAVAALTGTGHYHGGMLDRRAGTIQPFAYLSELARVAGEAGARLRTGTRVQSIAPHGAGWAVRTPAGTVQADKVLVATNADADGLIPGLAQTILPLHSFQIATEPLPGPLNAAILPGNQAVSDSRRIVTYYRKSPDGRFVLGGRGTLGPPRHERDWRHLRHAMTRLYPALAGMALTHRWFGRVAITLDYLPPVHAPAPGLLAVLGCQGRGVGLMTALGDSVAAYMASGDAADLPLPLSAIRPVPFHRFRHLGVAAAIAWYRMLDGMQR
jgi:glycine/D-amino acid oxidase-like deaminating enzyme